MFFHERRDDGLLQRFEHAYISALTGVRDMQAPDEGKVKKKKVKKEK